MQEKEVLEKESQRRQRAGGQRSRGTRVALLGETPAGGAGLAAGVPPPRAVRAAGARFSSRRLPVPSRTVILSRGRC